MRKLECKCGFYTCSNLIKELHIKGFCDTCEEGQNYQDKDDFKTILFNIIMKKKLIEIPKELFDKIQLLSVESNRSVNKEIVHQLQKAVEFTEIENGKIEANKDLRKCFNTDKEYLRFLKMVK